MSGDHRVSRERKISVQIVASSRYCDTSCDFMSPDAQMCTLFGPLKWDKRCKANGAIRPRGCRDQEIGDSEGA